MTQHSMVYGVSGDSYSDLKALRSAGIIDCHYIIHGGGSAPPTGFVTDCNAAGVSPVLNNGNDGAAGWNGSDSYNANVAAMGFHAVGGESEQADEIDSIMNHLIFLDYGGEGTGGGTNDCVWCSTHSAPVHGFGAASYMETYDSATNLWGWDVMSQGMLSAKAHGVKEIGLCVGTWMINHSSAQDYINIAQQMEANGVTCAGMVIWGGYNSDMNAVYNEFASWFQAWQAIWPPTNVTMKNRFGGAPPVSSINFASTPEINMIGGNMNIFVTGSDKALWHSPDNGKSWESLGGILTSAPTVVTRGSFIDVFACGSPNGVYQISWDIGGSKWGKWNSLGGLVLSGTAPTAFTPDGNQIDLYVIGTDKTLYCKTWDGTTWSGWVTVAQVLK